MKSNKILLTLLLGIFLFSITFVSADAVQDTNQKIAGLVKGISGRTILNVLGWIAFILVTGAGMWWVSGYYKNKKIFNKRITAFEDIGGFYEPTIRDTAKVVKLGKGGFEILYLKKLKTWKIGYGGRVGRNDYYFYIMPDGYWYNGRQKAGVNILDKNNGLVPIVTTNPLMRGQYTSLEKQIDSLHGEKVKFWDKYGSWVLSMSFVLIAGVMLWLSYREYAIVSGKLSGAIENMGIILDKLGNLAGNIQSNISNQGLVPA